MSFQICLACTTWLCCAFLLTGCESGDSPTNVTFVDRSERVPFFYETGDLEKDYIIAINGGGVALFDYDNDGLLDIYLVNGSSLENSKPPPSDRLFKNLGDWQFKDVTESAGLKESAWGCGVAAADYDNDGDTDLYVTNWGRNTLWKNLGEGRFEDVTESAGVGDTSWGSSCVFFDYDRDGHLDLFVANYLEFDPARVHRRGASHDCRYAGQAVACGPNGLPTSRCVLYRNRGNGTFVDASESSKISRIDKNRYGYSLGVALLDYDKDGWIDLYVANDTKANLLLRNREGEFEDVSSRAGVAFNDEGTAQSGMGVDAAFLGSRDSEDLFVVNFDRDTNTFYQNLGNGFFDEATGVRGLTPGYIDLGWATFFFDANLDGDLDLFIANGHVAPQVEHAENGASYAQKNRLFVGTKDLEFIDVTATAGPAFSLDKVSRGAAHGDLDGDGDLDIVVNELDAHVSVFENRSPSHNRWLGVRLQGTESARDAIGAVVSLKTSTTTRHRRVRSGSSYASESERIVRFGWSADERPLEIEVRWPSGTIQSFDTVSPGQVMTLREESSRP